MSEELSVDNSNKYNELLQDLTAHLGDKFTLAGVNHYEKHEKAELSKDEYHALMIKVRDHLFNDAGLPEDFPDVETAKKDIQELKKFVQEHQVSKDDMELVFDDIIADSKEHWPSEGGRRKRRSRTRGGKKTYRKKRRATKKSASRRRHK